MTITNDTIATVKATARGIEAETYSSPLALVMSQMNHPSIGGGKIYGDEGHKAGLVEVEKYLATVREQIAAENEAA